MSMSRMFYRWSDEDDRWHEHTGWLPKELDGAILAVKFDDEASMVMWSEDDGKHKALTASQRKLANGQAQRLLQDMEPGPPHEVQEAVSPSLSSPCFVSDDGMMAILDPSCQEQFWHSMRSFEPSHLILRPSREGESLRMACEAAEWQHLNGRAFLLMHSVQDREYVEDLLDSQDLLGRRVQCRFSDGLAMTGNSEYFLKSAMDAKVRNVRLTTENIGDLRRSREALQENVNGLQQNSKAHQESVDGFQQNSEAHQESVDGLQQNSEAHQVVVNYDICQEHGGGPKDCCQEHGGGHLADNECFASASELTEVEDMASRLLKQRDFSMVSLEKFLVRFPKLCSKNRQSDMKGVYYLFGLYAHGAKCGITNASRTLATFTRYLNELVSYQARCQGLKHATWSSIALGLNAGSRPHKDHHNKVSSKNYIFGVGGYSGGELWVESEEPRNPASSQYRWKWTPQGTRVAGQKHDIQYKMMEFDPRTWHASCKWAGKRIVISAFTSRAIDFATETTLRELREIGFRLPQDNVVYMFDGSHREGVGQFSSVFAEEEGDQAEMADAVGEADPEPSVEQVNLEPSAEEKRLVKKLHDNLGHPAPREMARSLKLANAKPHIIRYVAREFRCPFCEARIRPKPARPAVLPKVYEPGRVVGVDVIFLSALNRRETFPALNITDWGTSYQMVERLKSTEATHTWRTFMRVWCRTFGVPDVIVADLGSEFRGQFADLASQAGALIRHTAARSPWQAGKTERAGAHFKSVYEKARESSYIGSWEEIKTLMYAVECAKNRYGNRSGFSPMQRQIGHNLRLPGSLLSDDNLDPSMVVASADTEMRKTLEIRAAAQEAYIKSQTEVALSKAKNARSRAQVQFSAGETVYVYRQPNVRKRKHAITPESLEGRKPVWVGPGVVLAVETPSLWISMKGELWKASFEQCRHATSEEQVAKEILAGELEALKEELGRTTHKRTFRDMTGMGTPRDEEDDDVHRGAERFDSLSGGGGSERPAQRQRRDDGVDVAIPEDSELDYEPSEEEPGGDPVPEDLDFLLKDLKTLVAEPQSLSDPAETARQVMRNERLDGNPPGSAPYEAARRIMQHRPEGRHHPYFAEKLDEPSSSMWYSLEGDKWTWEPDVWEEVSQDIVIRQHNFPRQQLCNPAKVRGTLLPRRLKHRATYMVDENGEVHVHGDNWFKNRKKLNKTSYSWVGFTVFSSKEIDVKAFASGKNRGQGEVFEHEIKAEDWPGWRISDRQEWDKVAQTNAVKVLSVEESRRIRADPKESQRILPSRMVHILTLERYAPTLNSTSFGVLLQTAASMKYKATIGDLKNAFMQSSPLVRERGNLYASQPKSGIDGLDPEQLIQIISGCYGLNDAPSHWRQTLKEAILALGYQESVLDPTIYFLRTDEVLDGVIAVEVDDLFTFSNAVHEERMAQLQERFKFGKYEVVMESTEGVGFNGRRVRQLPTFDFEVDMTKFVCERLEPVALAKGRKSDVKALANDSEIAQVRAVIGGLNWAAKEGRPDCAAAASLGAACFPKPTIQDILDVNRAVKVLKERSELSIKIRAIEVDKLAWGVISDASFANAYGGHSQGAYGILAFHEDLREVVTLYNELQDKEFDLALWEAQMKKNKVSAIVSEDSDELLKSSLCIVDAKALYDHLSKETTGPSADKRTGLEMQVVRQNMSGINAKIRWIPHPRMVVDGLTKKHANLEALYELLDSGEYQIVSEAHALQEKRAERDERWTIISIGEGMVQEFNVTHPDLALKPFDRIEAVNGMSDDLSKAMAEAFENPKLGIASLRICRPKVLDVLIAKKGEPLGVKLNFTASSAGNLF
ncbi:putative transposon protein [Symbiodinium microadriaticum]|uniref:Putative transposon protein n=1 Tax=Symbiodinium microadriaticum TaxID=2951 RepID=A0A1Q9E2F5_SYMMI|nr:putative transposon protein [Symbiodinium microadriaticum]